MDASCTDPEWGQPQAGRPVMADAGAAAADSGQPDFMEVRENFKVHSI